MKKHIVDEKTGISYTLHSDYYLPDLTLPKEDKTTKRFEIYGGAGVRWTPLTQAEAPTEPTGETST